MRLFFDISCSATVPAARAAAPRPGALPPMRRAAAMTVAAAALWLGGIAGARAQSMEPLSYSNIPIGLNFLIAAFNHQWGSVLFDPSIPVTNVNASVNAADLGFSRGIDFWGQSGSFALAVPYAWVSASGDIYDTSKTVNRNGTGDAVLRLSINLLGAPALSPRQFASYHQDLIVGVSLVVTAPTGQYYHEKLVNIGTNRWSFKPEVGVSKALAPWTLEAAAGVTFYTDNDEFFGNNVRHQDPLYSLQGHAIYNFSPVLWGAVDGTYYAGGRTSLNGGEDNDLQQNSRWGGTLSYTINRYDSIKLYGSSGVSARTGTNFKTVGVAWQYRWGNGL